MSRVLRSSKEVIQLENLYGAHNYHPLPVVFSRALGAKVWDPEGKSYYDFLAGYSAVNQGHCHPRLLKTLTEQASKLTLSSRAFYNDKFCLFAEFVTKMFGYDMVLPMNTGAEGVETAIKISRKWAYMKKGVPENKALIFGCQNNFHGRTIGVISLSTDPDCTGGFGPLCPNIGCTCPITGRQIKYNSIEDLEHVLKTNAANTAAFIVEPIQGEAGVFVLDDGYLTKCKEICKKYNILFVTDEIQTGLGRTGYMLAAEHDKVKPDMVILGKALSGGMYPVSCVLANKELMLCIKPGQHGSTFGGNPLGSALAITALEILVDEKMCENSVRLGEIFRSKLEDSKPSFVSQIRGRGLMNAIVIDRNQLNENKTAWDLCLVLRDRGILCKPTHENIIRLTPPLCITEDELSESISIIKKTLDEFKSMPRSSIPKE